MDLRIKEVIKEKGMTITELADKMGINRVNLSNMVNGNPTVETLNRIADAIGCPVTELFVQPKKDALTINCPHIAERVSISRLNNSIKKDILNTQNSTYLKVYQN